MIALTVLGRHDCSLCDAMVAEITALALGPICTLEVRDVDADLESARRYGDRVPVLLADGEFVCAYRLDRERLERVLGGKATGRHV